ncbi:potential preautophagosome nucleating protein [Pseudozyma hubeiensis SY62]|uniref:Ubiquitin-like protein ATG12 n=1 Tax=Pseudozyma hubeiensis (strain SY62) TaxID=1305764 RepID=R9NYE0_PSEHS|nr:potential preautophagosome nucleating protein [Pseudozyma hubeiensis SY62]GAC93709.1 potential preautophagosome nucleating protein [Pseudozyma hubeiensis SY62]
MPHQDLDRQLESAATISTSASPSSAALQALEQYKKRDSSKVVVRFKAIGNAPIMKNNHFRITAFNRFQAVTVFLRKELNFKPTDSLFLYINASFSPAPDDTVGNLYRVSRSTKLLFSGQRNRELILTLLVSHEPILCCLPVVLRYRRSSDSQLQHNSCLGIDSRHRCMLLVDIYPWYPHH